MVSDEALKKLQEQIAAWPMTQRFVVQQLIEDYSNIRKALRACEDTGLTPEQCENARVIIEAAFSDDTLNAERIQELLKADKDGRLVALPCQSGEHVFALLDGQKRVRECEVKHAVLDGWRKIFYIVPVGGQGDAYSAPFGAFGKTVFLTRDEAEKALEARKDG